MQFETVQTKQNKDEVGTISFDKVNVADLGQKKDEYRRIPVPRHRITPLRQQWDSILKTLVEHMKL
jgi:RNA-binding protein PNO1